MSKQHPNVKTLREVRRGANFTMLPDEIDALDWAIRVCVAADNLVNVKGRHHTETAYRRLDDAVNASTKVDEDCQTELENRR